MLRDRNANRYLIVDPEPARATQTLDNTPIRADQIDHIACRILAKPPRGVSTIDVSKVSRWVVSGLPIGI